MAANILSLDHSLAPRLIKILYIIALIIIALGVVLRVGHGVVQIAHPPMQRTSMGASDGQASGADRMSPTMPQAAPGRPWIRPDGQGRHMGFGHGRFGRHRFHGLRFGLLGMVSPDQRPLVFGIVRIVGALIWGAVALMVVRILAELATALLALGLKERT